MIDLKLKGPSQSLLQKRQQVLERYAATKAARKKEQIDRELERPTKLQRLTPELTSDASSVPRSCSQSQTINSTSSPGDHLSASLLDVEAASLPPTLAYHPCRRRRKPREIIYVPKPLTRFQPHKNGQYNTFWNGALICFWGYAKSTKECPEGHCEDPSDICEDFDLLPVNWLNKMNDLAFDVSFVSPFLYH